MRVLFATSELFPWVKTGGLADVSHSLPEALARLGIDVVVMLPNYAQVREKLQQPKVLGEVDGFAIEGRTRILEATGGDQSYRIWLVDAPHLYDRAGGPYTTPENEDWPDNAWRFSFFNRVILEVATGRRNVGWRPDLVHCNDWQCGLVPALMQLEREPIPTVMTIHNLAYQGVFDWQTYQELLLPESWWYMEGVEFYGDFSFLKAGLVYSDAITTVSPTYAREIQTHRFGHGMEGVLLKYNDKLHGILNGVDYSIWSPERDGHLPFHYSANRLEGKAQNKQALQRDCGLAEEMDKPLIGVIGRLAEQKGIDLIEPIIRHTEHDAQWVILGSGDPTIEQHLRWLHNRHPKQISVNIGYDESLAHRIEAGADIFLMPSRYEPCGLNQMYSLRYGTVPVVHSVGGLVDSVEEVSVGPGHQYLGNGFRFDAPTSDSAEEALRRAFALFHNRQAWRVIQHNGMAKDFSWKHSAKTYSGLYRQLVDGK